MDTKQLTILTGNIGSGKSLTAAKLAKMGHVVVNGDSITSMVGGGEYGIYDKAKRDIYHAAEFAIIETAFVNGFSVVIDRTNMKVSDRARYIDVGKKHGAYIHSYDWGRGNEKSLARRLNKPNGVPAETWKSVHAFMMNSYEPVSLDEGFNSKESGPKDYTFYAFDFDGTIVENNFPEIGIIIEPTVEKMRGLWVDLRKIIIVWTCRSGDYANQAKAFMLKNNIPFDFINENPLFEMGSRKIFAHKYYDDRNAKNF
uniref:Putative ATPase domain containing protein n=2 Tax=viral metagenome TaxID=1070528 RepID=A0A6M3L8A9_9ZZZZ